MHKAPVNSLLAFCILNPSESTLQQQRQDMTPVGAVLIQEIIFLPQDEDDLAAGAQAVLRPSSALPCPQRRRR